MFRHMSHQLPSVVGGGEEEGDSRHSITSIRAFQAKPSEVGTAKRSYDFATRMLWEFNF